MLGLNRYIIFINDNSLNNLTEINVLKRKVSQKTLPYQTLQRYVNNQITNITKDKPVPIRTKFPIKRTFKKRKFIPVITGLPWNYYKNKYLIKYNYSFNVITFRIKLFLQLIIRIISGRNTNKQI